MHTLSIIISLDVLLQTSILEVLKQAARLNKQILAEQVEAVKHKHRSTR